MYQVMPSPRYVQLVQSKRAGGTGRGRYMRKNATQSEAIVWTWLRNRRFERWKFRRQHPVGRYVLDFYCDALRLAIEVDGDGHEPFEDEFRSAVLARQGILVKRLRNDVVVCRPHDTWERLISVIDARYAEILREQRRP
jgi:very-short-patch-repair endonuclease